MLNNLATITKAFCEHFRIYCSLSTISFGFHENRAAILLYHQASVKEERKTNSDIV